MRKQSLKQKDFDSYCMKYIREAEKQGACRFTPTRDTFNVFNRIDEMIKARHENLTCSFDNGEILIIKQQTTKPSTPSPRKARPKPLHPLMFVPLKKGYPTRFNQIVNE